MIKINKNTNPFILFLPFLIGYSIFVCMSFSAALWGDEIRHFTYANNLLNGFYSPPAPNIILENGPGYPLLLAIFLKLKVPIIFIKWVNALMLYLSVVYLYKSLLLVVRFKLALLYAFVWACFYNSLDFLPLLHSEVLSSFLIVLLIYFLIHAYRSPKPLFNKFIFLAGLMMGLLILTKIIFGYVLLCSIVGMGILYLFNKKSIAYKKAMLILIIAFATVIPYLTYTYSLTNRLFYWGTSGGNNLFWMSNPFKNEYGSWMLLPSLNQDTTNFTKEKRVSKNSFKVNERISLLPGTDDSLLAHYKADIIEINKYQGVEQDDAFKKIAYRNIKEYPLKFFKNCICNISRILFNFPYSYTPQKPFSFLRIPFTGTIFLLMLLSIYPAIVNWKKINFAIKSILFVTLLYLGGSIFGSAETRMFTIIVPALLIWLAAVLQHTIVINTKKWND